MSDSRFRFTFDRPATVELQCGDCDGAAVPLLASRTDGIAYGDAVTDGDHPDGRHAADVAHAWRHVGWCLACGETDGDHADGCACGVAVVTHDATGAATYPCDGVTGEQWNGWDVPLWSDPYAMRDVLSDVLGEDGTVTVEGDAVVVRRAGEPTESFTRDGRGVFRGQGWCWVAA